MRNKTTPLMRKPLSLHFPLSTALLALTSAAYAQPAAETEPRALLEITVSASPLGRTADELVQPIVLLADEELANKRRNTIGETLEQELGVSTTDFGPGAGRPVIRGQAGPRVEVLSNGISTMDAASVSPDHAVSGNPLIARQIEILKGPATLLYGSGAIGGVVNIVNNRLPTEVTEGFTGSVEASAGSVARENNVFGDFNYGVGNHQLHADITRSRAKDYKIPGFADIDGDDDAGVKRLNNSFNRIEDGALSYTFVSDEGHSFGMALSRYESTYGLPGHSHHHEEDHDDDHDDDHEAEVGPFTRLKQTRVDTQATIRDPFAGIESLRLKLSSARYQHEEIEDGDEVATTFRNREYQGRIEAVHQPIAGWRGVVGVQLGHRDFITTGEESFINNSERVLTRSTGVFVVEEFKTSFGKIEAGARIDRVNHDPDGANPSRSFNAYSGSAGVIFDVSNDTHIKLALSHAERAPAIEELYAEGEHLATRTEEQGNVNLRKERAQTIDLGFDHHMGRVDLEANVFFKQAKDYIFFDIEDFDEDHELFEGEYKQADAQFYGYEAAINVALKQTGDFRVSSRVFTDSVRGKFENGGGNVPRMTPTRYGLSLHGHYQKVAGSLSYIRAQSQDRVSSAAGVEVFETPTAGYELLNADITWQLPAQLTGKTQTSVFLRGTNLLNEEIRRSTSFVKDIAPAPGRGVVVGVRSAF